jgi:hypothetical protein
MEEAPMKMTLSLAMMVLMLSVSAVEATPIRGTFRGVVISNSNPSFDWPFLEGTPAWAVFGYDSDYLSPPADEFGNRYTSDREGYEGLFAVTIGRAGVGFSTAGSGSLLIGPNGLPAMGNGIGPGFDIGVGPNGFSIQAYGGEPATFVNVEGTYSLPDHESVLPLTVLGLAALAVARRFLPRVPSM